MRYDFRTKRTAGVVLGLAITLGAPTALAQQPKECPSIRTPSGECADAKLVDISRHRAGVVSSSYSSYFGTPLGVVGLQPIPYERLFRDDIKSFGLSTSTTTSTGVFVPTPDFGAAACGGPPGGCSITTTTRSK